jgi:adenine-specific DNA-methyltransferase
MRGFVPTPLATVDLMVAKLLDDLPAPGRCRLLDPGCGEGEFIDGVIRYCRARGVPLPHITGVELHPGRAAAARARFADVPEVEVLEADFLTTSYEAFDLIIGNPPYVSILGLDATERDAYRAAFATARGRFDLYMLFFEQALRLLRQEGRLVFITPEKYLYVETARPLRKLLLSRHVAELHFVHEDTFGGLVTYPLITVVSGKKTPSATRVVSRTGGVSMVALGTIDSWQPLLHGHEPDNGRLVLEDVALRVSCGVATGADPVFVCPSAGLPDGLRPFAYPTVSGRQLRAGVPPVPDRVMLAPYDASGQLLPERALGALGAFLRRPDRRTQLESRTCVARKQWYAYHDNFPIDVMRRPKLLCKDITEVPFFVVDRSGEIVPRHSVYYIVPADPDILEPLASHLNSDEVVDWMRAHCQRASKGFLRMQSSVLKNIPLPDSFIPRHGPLFARSHDREALLA